MADEVWLIGIGGYLGVRHHRNRNGRIPASQVGSEPHASHLHDHTGAPSSAQGSGALVSGLPRLHRPVPPEGISPCTIIDLYKRQDCK